MLLAIMSWVCAMRWFDCAAASSAPSPSSPIQLSSRTRGKRAVGVAQLLQDPTDEIRRERVAAADEVAQHLVERAAVLVGGAPDALGPGVGLLDLVEPLDGAQGHAPDVLDEPQAQHGRHGPQLADGKRLDRLERLHEQLDVAEIDPPLRVRDERDRQLVDPGVAGERAPGQLGQLAVIAPRQAVAHLADVLLHDVVVVEQPLSRRPDVGLGRSQPGVGAGQDGLRAIQPGQQGCPPPLAATGDPPLAGEGAGPLGQMLGPQQLAPKRYGDQLLPFPGRWPDETVQHGMAFWLGERDRRAEYNHAFTAGAEGIPAPGRSERNFPGPEASAQLCRRRRLTQGGGFFCSASGFERE